jgi:hypothetical protein
LGSGKLINNKISEVSLVFLSKSFQDRISGRSIVTENGTTLLQEHQSSYSTLFGGQKGLLSTENAYLLDLTV